MGGSAVADFMATARRLLGGGVSADSLEAIGRSLAAAGRAEDFVPDSEMRAMHGGDSQFTVLQSDPDGLTLVLGHFSAREETAVHDHDSWGVACVIRGRDRYKSWTLDADGMVRLAWQRELGAGSFVTWLGPPHDIHSQQGIDEPALELILFGKNVMTLPRHYYDPVSGRVTTALPQR